MCFQTLGHSCPLGFRGFSCFRASGLPVWERRLKRRPVVYGLLEGAIHVFTQSTFLAALCAVSALVPGVCFLSEECCALISSVYVSWDSSMLLSHWDLKLETPVRHFSISSNTGYTALLSQVGELMSNFDIFF